MDKKIQFIDVYDVWYAPLLQTKSFYLLVGLLTVIIFGYIFYRVLRYLNYKKTILSYDQKALQDLALLNDVAQPDEIKSAYFFITAILKDYFYGLYGTLLDNKTDDEMIDFLQKNYQGHDLDRLTEIFKRAFVAKFAGMTVSLTVLREDIEYLKEFIIKTTKYFAEQKDSH